MRTSEQLHTCSLGENLLEHYLDDFSKKLKLPANS